MTSYVAGGQAIFLKKNACFLLSLGEKWKHCQQKAAINYVIFYKSSNFYFSVKSKMAPKMAAILDDVTGNQQGGNP